MTEYKWNPGARVPKGANAQEIGEHLDNLREQSGGSLTADDVLKDAADAESPIHNFFEWDDTEAARQHRLEQARGLVRSVVVVYRRNETETMPIRAFVRVVKDDNEGAYVSTITAMSDAEMRQQVLRRALAEIQAFRRKYGELYEFAQLFASLDEIEAALPDRLAG